jgi:hypothetical protein
LHLNLILKFVQNNVLFVANQVIFMKKGEKERKTKTKGNKREQANNAFLPHALPREIWNNIP